MDPRWFPARDRPTGPWLPLLGTAYTTGVAALLLPPGRLRISLGLPPLVLMLCRARTITSGKSAEDYLGAINLFTLLLRWTDYVILRKPEDDFHHVIQEAAGESPEDVGAMNLWQKLGWSTSLFFTWRGVGWNWRVKNVPSVASNHLTKAFVTSQLTKFIRLYLLLDLVVYLQAYGMSSTNHSDRLHSLPVAHKLMLCWLAGARMVCDTSIAYHLFAALAVMFRLSDPQSWPDMYGRWSEAYTVRNLWGRCWHQLLRRIFETYTSLLVSALRLRKGSFFSRYTKLYGSFLISAIIHHVGSLNVPWMPGVKSQFLFFMIQPVFISIEDGVIHLGHQFGVRSNRQTRILRYIWVFVAISLSLPYLVAHLYELAMLDDRLVLEPPLLVWRPTKYLHRLAC